MEQVLADTPRFVVSARKYRPATFNTVVGQAHVTTTLKNAVASGKLAQAFLFCGPRGVGKTTCARILAKTINCTNRTADTEACDECDSCRAFNASASFNVHELDAASNNSVDDIRALVEQVRYAPQAGRYKVYIIDEVHMLSNAAFNAFLKTLEEPPAHAIFILATTERHKIIPTILSRCQTFDFNRIRPDDMVHHLAAIAEQEGVTAEADGLHLIAQKADGGLRDALSIFDQIVTFSGGNITYRAVADNLHVLDYDTYFRLTEALLIENHAQALLLFDEVLRHGFDGHLFVTGWANHLRDVLVSQTPATVALLEVADSVKVRYAEQAQQAPAAWLLSALTLAGTCDRDYKQARHQRLHVELLLLRAAHLRSALRFSDGMPAGALAAASAAPAASPSDGEAKKKSNDPSLAPASSATVAPEVSISADIRPVYALPAAAVVANGQAANDASDNGTSKAAVQEVVSGRAPVSANGAAVVAIPVSEVTQGRKLVAPLMPNGLRMPGMADALAPKPTASQAAGATADPGTTFGLEPVTKEAFAAAFVVLTEAFKAENRMNEYTLFNRAFEFDSATLEVQLPVDNAVQMARFAELKPDLLTQLRTQLRNGRLTLTAYITQRPQEQRLYTDSDKLTYLMHKFPALVELRERLHLEPIF
jgi:DNA polymerase III subunit gamma/tau